MFLPRRILPSDTLENGFRVAHNETVDAMPDYSKCQVTDAGLLQFYNDQSEFIGEIDLSTVFRKITDLGGSGAPPQFYSASETSEGVGKIASADDVAAGNNQYDWVTPATLAYAFDLLKDELSPTLEQVLTAGGSTIQSINFISQSQTGTYFRDTGGNVTGFVGKRADGTLVFVDTLHGASITTETDGSVRVNGVKILLDGQVQTKTPGIDDVLLIDNYTTNSLRLGGLGLADRVLVNEPTSLPCYVESVNPVTGEKTLYVEKTSVEAVVTRAFSYASPQTLAYWLSKLVGQNTATGRVLYTHGGAFCVQIAKGTSQMGDDTLVPIQGLVDGDILAHGLGSGTYLQVIYDSIGRVVSNAFLEPLNPVDLLKSKFRNPGIADPFTGTAKLTPLPTIAN